MTETFIESGALKIIQSLLGKIMHADRQAAIREIRRLKKQGSTNHDRAATARQLHDLKDRVKASASIRAWRVQHRPKPVYDTNLPIIAKKDEIIDAVRKHQVIIVAGETGSGKTTQLPKFCLEAGRGIAGIIGSTQPRRIAAVTVAHRIAEEFSEPPGRSVGYKIRFQDRFIRDRAFIKLMTDGILLAEAQGDRYLNEYDTLIIDEAHERSLNIDFILGMLRGLLKIRKELKLIITSATIDTAKFSHAFDEAPVIEVSGRMYPVEVRYEQAAGEEEAEEQTYVEKAVNAINGIVNTTRSGDILVFMPTEQDIRETCELLEGRKFKHTSILPLFARLSATDQMKVFATDSRRKIIAATNVAETSITIPGIRYVVDTGLARILRYDPRSRTTSLPVMPISKSSADQRKGRCGRLENGICVRLFSEEDYISRPQYTPPEILRANLSEVILRMIALDLGDIKQFPFIDPPPARQIKDGFDMLLELGAIETLRGKTTEHENIRLTEQGRLMAKIPLDPRLSRILIEANRNGCLSEAAVIVSALTIPDPRERPEENLQKAETAHNRYKDPASDFISLYNIWKACFGEPESGKTVRARDLKKFCKENFMSFKRMREWQDIHEQIKGILEESDIHENKTRKDAGAGRRIGGAESDGADFSAKYIAIHKSILSGFLSNIAVKKEKNIYQAAKQREVMLFPGSGLFNKGGQWIVSADIVETSRLFARIVANIDSSWLEPLGKTQCKYSHFNPRWEKKREAVVADEQVSLYGLVIVVKRTVLFGPIRPEEAAEILIRGALIDGDVKTVLPFMSYNWSLINEVHDMENRIRRRDLLVSEEALMEFYRSRLAGVFDMTGLKKILKIKGSDDFLRMDRSDVLAAVPDDSQLSLFPDTIKLGQTKFPCDYRFEPGKDDDGVTVKMPVSVASAVPVEETDWIIPGLLEEKITNLIKGLPKEFRKKLVPVSDTVNVIMREMPKYKGSLISTLSGFIYKRFGVDVPASVWAEDQLSEYLKMRIALTDMDGRELASSRDKSILRQPIAAAGFDEAFEKERRKWEKTGLSTWDFPDLPDVVMAASANGLEFPLFPALEKKMDKFNLRLFKDRQAAAQSHIHGVAQLYCLYFANDLKFLKKNLAMPPDMEKAANYFGGRKQVEARLLNKVVEGLFAQPIRSQKEFHAHARSCVNRILAAGNAAMESVLPVIEAYAQARELIYTLEKANAKDPVVSSFLREIRNSLTRIVPENFIELYNYQRMSHLGRYIKATMLRAQRGAHDIEKDRKKTLKVKPVEDELNQLVFGLNPLTSAEKREAIEKLVWMIEEFKVSLFAQELKTAFPISPKKIEEKIKDIYRMG